MKEIAYELKIEDKVIFTGNRSDVPNMMNLFDVFVFPSIYEGLGIALIEAQAAGLPCVVSKIRGNIDLIEENIGGYLCDSTDIDSFANAINKLVNNKIIRRVFSENNKKTIKNYDTKCVLKIMSRIYFDN